MYMVPATASPWQAPPAGFPQTPHLLFPSFAPEVTSFPLCTSTGKVIKRAEGKHKTKNKNQPSAEAGLSITAFCTGEHCQAGRKCRWHFTDPRSHLTLSNAFWKASCKQVGQKTNAGGEMLKKPVFYSQHYQWHAIWFLPNRLAAARFSIPNCKTELIEFATPPGYHKH